MQQERDFESHRARMAESRFAALKDKTCEFVKPSIVRLPAEGFFLVAKLQADVRRLQDDLHERRLHRLESSQSILQDARSRIQVLHDSVSIVYTVLSSYTR